MAYVLLGCRGLIALVFVVSAVSKLRNRQAFAQFVAATGRLSPRPLPTATPRRLAIGVVAAELALVALLLPPATVPVGFGLAVALLLAFTGSILAAVRRGERAPCRCFGSSEQPLGYVQVVRNLILLVVASLGLVAALSTSASIELPAALLAVATGAIAGILVTAFDDIVAVFSPTAGGPPR